MAQTKVSLIKDQIIDVNHLKADHGITTDHVSEGSTRQYFTESRVQNILTTNNYIRTSDVANLETVTNLSINANVLSYTNEAGVTTNIDLSVYLDDSNLARIVSGALSPVTGIATFTRDDSSTFTVDFSAFLSDANDYVTSASFNTTSGVLTLTRLGGGTVTVDLDNRYLTSFTETDPTVPAHVKSITTTQVSNWNTAYGWGNHAGLYQPLNSTLSRFSDSSWAGTSGYPGYTFVGGNSRIGFSSTSGVVDVYADGNFYATDSSHRVWHAGDFSSTNVSNWNTAYGWGNHAGLYLPISGKAADSNLLDGIDSSNFFRTDGTYPNTDMNDTVEGYWHVASGSANLPVNQYGHRWDYDHIQNGQWVFQMYSPTGGDVDLWFRQKRNFSATPWQKVITSSNIGSQSVSYATSSGNASTLQGRTIGSSTDNIAFLGSTRNLVINDPESYIGEVRLGAAWNYGGVYASNTLTMSSSSDINFVIGNNVYANLTTDYFSHNGKILMGTFPQSTVNSGAAWIGRAADRALGTMTVQLGGDANRTFEVVDHAWSIVTFNVNGSGTATAAGSFRAPIFYDSNNTGYYIDPNSTSNISNLHLDGYIHVSRSNTTGNGIILADDGDIVDLNDAYLSMRFSYGVRIFSANRGGSAVHTLHSDGNAYFNTSARSPIFYDNNDTNYYVDPNSTSVLNAANFNKIGGFLDAAFTDFYVYGDENTYYPVIISGSAGYGFHEYSITRGYGWTAPWNPIGTGSHKGGLTFNFYWSGDTAWGGNDHTIRVKQFTEQYTTMVAGLALPVTGGVCVWLRGGGSGGALYRLRAPRGHNHGYTVYDGVSASGHSTSTTFTAANGATFSARTNTSNNSGEIYGRYPVRGTNEIAAGSVTATSVDAGTVYGDDVYTTGGWFRNHTNTNGIYWSTTGWHLNPYNSNDFTMRSGSSVESTIRFANSSDTTWGYIHNDANKTIGFLNNSRSWVSYTDTSGNHFSVGSSRAPIFYDSNNTGYYTNPAGTSYLYDLDMPHLANGTENIRANIGGQENWRAIALSGGSQDNVGWGIHGTSRSVFGRSGTSIHFPDDGSFRLHTNGWDTEFEVAGGGEGWLKGGLRSSIFYDNNNTSYYVDPASGSFQAGTHSINTAPETSVSLKISSNGAGGSSCLRMFANSYGTVGYFEFPAYSGGITAKNAASFGQNAFSFLYSNNANVGSIRINSTSTSYNTTSDYRLKENFTPINNGIERVKLLKPKRFNFIGDENVVDGFIAHEAQEVVPEAVSGEKDAIGWDGNPEYQGIDQSKLVPLLTAALQEAISKIENLESRIQLLERQ